MSKVIAGMALTVIALPLILVFAAIVSLIIAWPVMLFVGNAHIVSDGVVPTLGYWTVFWLTWAFSLVTARVTSSKD